MNPDDIAYRADAPVRMGRVAFRVDRGHLARWGHGWVRDEEVVVVKVNVDSFVRAETSFQFDRMVAIAGGVNRWAHNRVPTPVDAQNVIQGQGPKPMTRTASTA